MPSQSIAVHNQMTEDSKDLTPTTVELFAKLFEHFTRHNAPPNRVTFEGIISKATLLGYPNLAKAASQDLLALGTKLNESTATNMLKTVRNAFVDRAPSSNDVY